MQRPLLLVPYISLRFLALEKDLALGLGDFYNFFSVTASVSEVTHGKNMPRAPSFLLDPYMT